MKPDPNEVKQIAEWLKNYEKYNYEQGLISYFLSKSHEWAERSFDSERNINKVLEVGAGTGIHLNFIKHKYKEYWLTDKNKTLVRMLKNKMHKKDNNIFVQQEDATNLSFQNKIFDRLIAAHILEHLYYPHKVLREWERVVKPGGIITVILPCDPGLFWRIGRSFFARPKYKNSGFNYDYLMAREHVNPINNLVSFIRYYFDRIEEKWYPFDFPSMDFNLFYIVNIHV